MIMGVDIDMVHVSITHEIEFALAIVVLEGT